MLCHPWRIRHYARPVPSHVRPLHFLTLHPLHSLTQLLSSCSLSSFDDIKALLESGMSREPYSCRFRSTYLISYLSCRHDVFVCPYGADYQGLSKIGPFPCLERPRLVLL